MRKFFIFIFISFLMLGCAQQQNQQQNSFRIDGFIKDLNEPAKMYLSYRYDGQRVRDTVMIENGKFVFTGEISDPVEARLTLDRTKVGQTDADENKFSTYIYIHRGNLKISSDNSLKDIVVKHSKINDDYKRYNELLSETQSFKDSLDNVWISAAPEQRNDSLRKVMMASWKPVLEKQNEQKRSFVENNPTSFLSLIVLEELADAEFIPSEEVESLFLKLTEKVRETETGKEFARRIMIAKATEIGKPAINFTQTDTLGNPVSLTDFRGKYVLLDFWASWCGPCRRENPNIVEAFHKYKDKGFTVLGVSLDDDKQEWMDGIHKDQLCWTQVSDLKMFDNEVAKLYDIRAIPQNFLIDPNGIIVAKDIRGEALHEKLAEILD